MKAYLTEFIGTFFLVLTIGLSTNQPGVAPAPLAIGAALMVMVYMGGPISGAHYNPAVTIAVWLRGKLAAKDVFPYLLAQLAGAMNAALVVTAILGVSFAPAPAFGVEIGKALLVEFLFTFALALVVLNVATSSKSAGNSYFGLAIGFTVCAAAFAGGGISGGAYNPAVGVGPALARLLTGSGDAPPGVWIYLVGPFAGGVAASLVYRLQNPDEFAPR